MTIRPSCRGRSCRRSERPASASPICRCFTSQAASAARRRNRASAASCTISTASPRLLEASAQRVRGRPRSAPRHRAALAARGAGRRAAGGDRDRWIGSTRTRRSTSTSPSRRKEVHDCLAWCGRRPVAHLLDVAPVGRRWCLIHATHMDDDETAALARSGAVAGLCPTTEANLGDGLFNLAAFLEAGGRFGIGSDSHVSVSPVEELRWLEYGQRADRAAPPGRGERGRAPLRRPALAGGAGRRRPGARPPDRRARARLPRRPDPRSTPTTRCSAAATRRPPARRAGVLRQRQPGAGRHGRRPLAGQGRPPRRPRAHRHGLSPDHRRADLIGVRSAAAATRGRGRALRHGLCGLVRGSGAAS